MLWVDKHRPNSFDKFVLNRDIASNLQKLVSDGDCTHILFYGPSGAGKKTLINALLREIYGPGAEKVKVEHRPWEIDVPGRSTKLEVELTTLSSNYHTELNPSDVGYNDRYVVQAIIKEMAKSKPLDIVSAHAAAQGGAVAAAEKGPNFKIVVLNEVDRLSKEAQASLRRTMEKYSSACRLIMCCNNISRVIDPLRSRCLCVRVAAPSQDRVMELLNHVSRQEKLGALPPQLAAAIAQSSGRNLRRALLSLEACKVQQHPFTPEQKVPGADWELYLGEVAQDVMQEQSPKRLYQCRGKLYELLVNCIPPELIFRRLVQELSSRVDESVKHELVAAAATFEHRMQEGSKPIFHLEAFLARVMFVVKEQVEKAIMAGMR